MNLKKIGRFLFSMRFAIGLLILLTMVCIAGSVIPQGETEAVYRNTYPTFGGILLALDLDDVFHSWWFALLTAVLCLNLLGCNLLRFPAIMKRMKNGFSLKKRLEGKEEGFPFTGDPTIVFRSMGFLKAEEEEAGTAAGYYAVRHKIGLWGAWLTHLGMLILIVGFALGQMFSETYVVYGVPGTTAQIGDTDYSLTINDFSVNLREDDTVEQYTSALTVTENVTGETVAGTASVNNPLDAFGFRMYQNSMGWAADVIIAKGEELLASGPMCAGEMTQVPGLEDLVLYFRAFYPDYVTGADGMPANASDHLNNPGYLYVIYYKDELIGMNVLKEGEYITVEDYIFLFSNPRYYSLIQIKRDPFAPIALIGGLLILLALLLAFYIRCEEIWAVPDGNGGWIVNGRSLRGGIMYREKLMRTVEREQNKLVEKGETK